MRFADLITVPPIVPTAATVVKALVIPEDPTTKEGTFYYPGIGALFVSRVGGQTLVEAAAIKGDGVAARASWLRARCEEIFGDEMTDLGKPSSRQARA